MDLQPFLDWLQNGTGSVHCQLSDDTRDPAADPVPPPRLYVGLLEIEQPASDRTVMRAPPAVPTLVGRRGWDLRPRLCSWRWSTQRGRDLQHRYRPRRVLRVSQRHVNQPADRIPGQQRALRDRNRPLLGGGSSATSVAPDGRLPRPLHDHNCAVVEAIVHRHAHEPTRRQVPPALAPWWRMSYRRRQMPVSS
jgi:hypothetical protein